MNVRLDSVISNIMGKSGLAILGAIVKGDREPAASGDVAESPHQGFGGSGGRESGRDVAQGASDDLKEGLKHYDFIDRRIGILKRTVQAKLKALAKTSDEKSASTSDSPSGTSYSAPNSILGAKDFDRNSRTARARLAQDLLGRGFDGDSDYRGEDDASGRRRNRYRFDLFLPDARAFLFLGLGLAQGKYINEDRQLRSQGRTPVNRVGQALNHRPCLRGAATGGVVVDIVSESTRLVFSRWQIQCKNTTRLSLDDIAKV